MERRRMTFLSRFSGYGLAVLGLLFVVLFLTSRQFRSGIPGYLAARDWCYLLTCNWKSDLRTGFVWKDRVWKPVDLELFARKCRIKARDGGLVQWESSIGTFWLPSAEGIGSLGDMASVIQQDIYAYKAEVSAPAILFWIAVPTWDPLRERRWKRAQVL
jgi:hypothetical protein